jgi:putative Holliday junction resolvase
VRVVGLDLGSRRVGVAVSDAGGTLASPHTVIVRSGDDERDRVAIRAVVDEYEAERVVVGLPLSLDGTDGPAARAARAVAEALGAVLPVPVELWDERLTTVSADRDLIALRMKADARRRVVDKVAAAVMLQSWLDAHG